ncbi:hypothetical protein [Nocardioides sp.]|uniref:hypothetical protein n=1 Tax=Nocardioides sp. TaxID=35761 RepID=UPI002732C0D1|nr:hypothetical protein [Nocardioides sp.]MDP3893881.1 hypothetical protein [Nocardioides sp.]
MSKRGSRIPLADRVRDGQPAPAAPVARPDDACPARHCWVADAVDRYGVKRPGLLAEWRQGPDDWEGRVVYAAQLRPGEWQLVEEWLPAGLLTQL